MIGLLLRIPFLLHGGEAIKPCQSQSTADDVNRSDEPSNFRVRTKHVFQHNLVHEKCRHHAEGHHIGQRVELPAKGTFVTAQSRHAPVKDIKHARQQNQPQGVPDGAVVRIHPGKIGLHNFGQRKKSTEEVGRREQVGQEINLQFLAAAFRLGGTIRPV